MHWTLAYTTACTVDHGLYGSTSFSHSLDYSKLSNNFNTKLGNGCWATGAPQKMMRTMYTVPRTAYPEQCRPKSYINVIKLQI